MGGEEREEEWGGRGVGGEGQGRWRALSGSELEELSCREVCEYMHACDERAATDRRPGCDDDSAKEERQRRELARSRAARTRAQEHQELASEDEQLPLLQQGGGGESGYYGRLAEAAVRHVLKRDLLRLLADEALDLLLVTLAGTGRLLCMCPHATAGSLLVTLAGTRLLYVSACYG